MRILTISNLFPRPDRPTLGMFNAQLFAEVAKMASVRNVCLVPEWRLWRWAAIRKWQAPDKSDLPTRYQPVFYLPLIGRNWAAESYASSLRGRVVELRDTDAVLAAWLYPDGVAAARLAREAGVPAWILVQGSDTFHLANPRKKAAILACANHAAGFLCVCRLLADRIVQAGVPAAMVHVVLNGVDAARFRLLPKSECAARIAAAIPGIPIQSAKNAVFSGAERVNVPARIVSSTGGSASGGTDSAPTYNSKIILFVGNLVPVKGPDVALEAFAELLRMTERTFAELVFVGDGPMRRRLETVVRERHLEGCVKFVGARPHDEIVDWMNVADVLILSSRSEGMPNVVLEALACGMPVVAMDVGACREMLAREASARVVAAGDATGMASAIRELLGREINRVELAARHGRRTWADMAREIVGNVSKGKE